MSTRRLVLVMFAGVFTLSLGGAARAQMGGGQQPCRADIQTLCKGVPQGGGKIRDCLRQHASELSPGCKEKMERNQGIFAQGGSGGSATMLEVCDEDKKKHCPKVEAGGGRIRQCLKTHLAELSPKCKAVIQESSQGARRRAAGFRVACRDELGKLCRGTEPGGGRLMDCLKKHESELSAGCRTALSDTKAAQPAKPKPQ
jgi:hypothetical protein